MSGGSGAISAIPALAAAGATAYGAYAGSKTPKVKKDKESERLLAEQQANEQKRAASADRALMSSRRARNAMGQGGGRGGLAYVKPLIGQGVTLG